VYEKQVEIPAPYIKDPSEKKYTLVLDLDETLIHFKVVIKWLIFQDSQDESKGILRIRPGLFEFLNLMKEYYELVIFTAATQEVSSKIYLVRRSYHRCDRTWWTDIQIQTLPSTRHNKRWRVFKGSFQNWKGAWKYNYCR